MIVGNIECVLSDVDGVWTDNRLWFGGAGPLKSFDVRDGHGAVMLRKAGLPVAFVTGRDDAAMRARAQELGIEWEIAHRERPKGEIVRELMARYGVAPEHTVFVGDDLTDLAAFAEVGWPIAVADAEPEVRRAARRVTRARGGQGAFREVVRWILHH